MFKVWLCGHNGEVREKIMIIVKSFIESETGENIGISFSEARKVTVLYAKKNKKGFLETFIPYSHENIVQPENLKLGVVQLLHSQLNNNQSETLAGYKNAVEINKYGNECTLYVLVERE